MRMILFALLLFLPLSAEAGQTSGWVGAAPTAAPEFVERVAADRPVVAAPAAATPVAGRPTPHVPIARGRGVLVLEGGGAASNMVTGRIVGAVAPGMILCVIQTAMHGLGEERNRFARVSGLQIESFDLGPDAPASAADLARLATCTGYYFSGGDPERLSQTFVPEGRPSPALQIIRDRHLSQLAAVTGSSAGAMIVGRTTLCECGTGSSRSALLDGQLFEAPGFGLIDPSILIDAHFFARGLLGRHVWEMARRGFRVGVGIDEQTAVVVPSGTGPWEVIGRRAVALIRAPAHASINNLTGFTLSMLAPGDRFDPITGAVHVSRLRRPLPTRDRAQAAPPHVDDIFARDRIRRLILQLAAGRATQAVGEAADGRIQVTLRRTTETRAFRDAAGTTVLDLALDIEVER